MILNISCINFDSIEGVKNHPEMDCVVCSQTTFNSVPTLSEMQTKALVLALATRGLGYKKALVNHPPYFTPILVEVLKQHNIIPVFAVMVNNEYIGLLEY